MHTVYSTKQIIIVFSLLCLYHTIAALSRNMTIMCCTYRHGKRWYMHNICVCVRAILYAPLLNSVTFKPLHIHVSTPHMSDFSTLLHKRLQIATEAKPSLYISGVLHYLSMTSHRSLVNFCLFRADFSTYMQYPVCTVSLNSSNVHVHVHVGTLSMVIW